MNLEELLQLGAADKPKKVTANVCGQDVELYVKPNSADDDLAQYKDFVEHGLINQDGSETGDTKGYLRVAANRIARHLVDESGERVLTAEQAIKQKAAWIRSVDNAIAGALQESNAETVKETAKN